MEFKHNYVALIACAVLCFVHAQPVKQAPLLKEVPAEVIFRVEKVPRPFELVCDVESGDSSGIQYVWNKGDEPLDVKSNPDIEQQQGKLIFKLPKDSDEGSYQCFANGSSGVASTRRIRVRKAYINTRPDALKRVKPVEGRPFQLDCPVPEGYPKPTIEWKRQSIADSNKVETILNPRIFSPQGNLYFSNATSDDVSNDLKYVCFAKSPAVDQEVALAEYIVEGLTSDTKPADNEVVQQYVSSSFTAKVGDVTEIYCVYGGNPMPHPDWWKDGVNVNNSPGDRVTRHNRSRGRRLLIKETLVEDEGQYVCIIDNEVGKVQNHSIRLSVVSAPRFAKKPEKRVAATVGQDVVLPCEVLNVAPSVERFWTYNADPIDNSKFSVTELALTIKNVQKSDEGYYGCRAINDLGEDYIETFLQVS